MGIPVEVPGLDTIIPELGEGRLVVVESAADPAKSFFVRRLGLTAAHLGGSVTFVTSRDREELQRLLTQESGLFPGLNGNVHIEEADSVHDLDGFARSGGLLAVDSFSFLTLGLPAGDLGALLKGVRARGRERKLTTVLGTDRGMVDPRSEAVVTHLADGVIQFHARESPEGLVRFLRIPKWTDGKFVDRNIFYEFDGKRIAVDLRSRVL